MEDAREVSEMRFRGSKDEVAPQDISQEPTGVMPEKARKAIGRTPTGTVFHVPHTTDMVSTILDPRQPKSEWDIFIIAMIAGHIGLYFATSGWARKAAFLLIFTFWRCCYNLGIGMALHHQSNRNLLVKTAKKYKLFDRFVNPKVFNFMKRQLADKMGPDYDFESSPIEYQTWLLFRRGVDLILMLDFCSYVLLAVSWSYVPSSHSILMHILRWSLGWSLILFNLWVKLDANRVVRDFAWYWGDFFYLIDSDLTFDGVYELCMHPMYSLGYAGYYGISLLACSYAVLFTSIVAHISQFIFLYVVEEPHIHKTYSPKSQLRIQSRSQQTKEMISTEAAFKRTASNSHDNLHAKMNDETEVSVFRAVDPFRATDLTQILIITLGVLFAVLTPQRGAYQWFSVAQAFIWRLLHSFGCFYSLGGQSHDKRWTKHFLKYGDSPKKAWREWKDIYALSLTMMHTTFMIAAWKLYSIPVDWQYSTCTLRHVLGIALVLMHVWTSISIYDVLGDFGWYFGDFFVDTEVPKLKYTGVYRYLNNPERIVYSFWGFALMANSTGVIVLAIEAQILNLLFITLIEKPHMEKLYGEQIRKEAGFTRSLKSMPVVDHPQVKKKVEELESSLDRIMDIAITTVRYCLRRALPHIDKAVKKSRVRMHRYSNSITVTRRAGSLNGFDLDKYSVDISKSDNSVTTERLGPHAFALGEAIRVRWNAPPNHTNNDWVGIYKITDNLSREVTKVSSQGRWSALHSEGFDTHLDHILKEETHSGVIEFRGEILPWTTGSYELRYHHNGKHNVMAISPPFEIAVESSKANSLSQVGLELLPFIGQILESEQGINVPASVEDIILFGDDAEKYATRIAYGIQAKYGLDFAWQLLAGDESVAGIAARITSSRKILAPFVRYQGQDEKLIAKKESHYVPPT